MHVRLHHLPILDPNTGTALSICMYSSIPATQAQVLRDSREGIIHATSNHCPNDSS